MATASIRRESSKRRKAIANTYAVSTLKETRSTLGRKPWRMNRWSLAFTVEIVTISLLLSAIGLKSIHLVMRSDDAPMEDNQAEFRPLVEKESTHQAGSVSEIVPDDSLNLVSGDEKLQQDPEAGSDSAVLARETHHLSKYEGLEQDQLKALSKQGQVNFRIVVLTMNRPDALRRLLESLKRAPTDGDRVDLTIWIDLMNKEKEHHPETVKIAEEFEWNLGEKTVKKREERMGLIKNWIYCWSANPQDPLERPIVLEDDLEVSPLYYRWLKAAVAKYDSIPDLSSYTLQRITLVPTTGQTKGLKNMNEGAFLYRLLGTWGFSPKPEVWTEFQQWYELHSGNKTFLPHVDGLKINDWYHGREWSNWFIRFTEEKNSYVLHHQVLSTKATLVGNWREPGEHYGKGPAKGLDFPILTEEDNEKFCFPDQESLVRLDWSGQPSLDHHSIFYREHKEDVDALVKYAKLEQGGQISFSLVNMNFMPFMKSFQCNVDMFKIRPNGLTWITNDKHALKELSKDASYKSFLIQFQGGEKERGTTFGSPGYWELMISRARLVLELLMNDITVLLFDADQVWLKDPIPYVNEHLKDPEVDVVGILTSQNEVGGNFVYLRPSSRVKAMYTQLVDMFIADYDKKKVQDKAGDRIVIQNDQTLLSSLVHRNEKWKAKFGIVFRSLDMDIFPDGRWYKGAYKTNHKSYDPVLINNNFVEGNDEKMKRVISYGHWFWDEKKKTCVKPETTKYYADDGKYRTIPLRYPWETTDENSEAVPSQ